MQTSNDTGVLSWITSGRCDLVADIRFPRQDDQVDLSAIVDHLVDEIGGRLGAPAAAQANNNRTGPIPGRRSLSRDALEAPRSEGHELTEKEERRRALQFAKEAEKAEREQQRFAMLDEDLQQERENETEAPSSVEDEEDKIVSIDLDIRFRDLKASVPVGFVRGLAIPSCIRGSPVFSLPAVLHVGPLLHQQRPRPTHRGLHQPEPDPDSDQVPHRPRPERVQRQLDDVRRRDPRPHVGAGLRGARAPRRPVERSEDPDGRVVDAADDGEFGPERAQEQLYPRAVLAVALYSFFAINTTYVCQGVR